MAVDVPLAHLDRLFDYCIPGKLLEEARPGVRVTVPFAGQVVDGWLVSVGDPETDGKLADLRSVISPIDFDVLRQELSGTIVIWP